MTETIANKSTKKATLKVDKTKLIEEKITELLAARVAHQIAMIEWENAHSEAGVKKKTMELRQVELNGIVTDIDQIRSGHYQMPLPFEKSDSPAPVAVKSEGPWRDVLLSTIFSGGVLQTLAESGLTTLGKLSEYTESGHQLTELRGVGDSKAAKIEDTLSAFWEANPQYAEVLTGGGEAKL